MIRSRVGSKYPIFSGTVRNRAANEGAATR
jgi:hypothetical protein